MQSRKQYTDEEILAARNRLAQKKAAQDEMKKNNLFSKFGLQPTGGYTDQDIIAARNRLAQKAGGAVHLKNPLAGFLEGVKETGLDYLKGSQAAMGKFEPGGETIAQQIGLSPGKTKAKQLPSVEETKLGKFDPYKEMGIGKEPFSTLAGKEQFAGKYGFPVIAGLSQIGKEIGKITKSGIVKDILNKEDKIKNIFNDLYENIWQEAKSKGYSNVNIKEPKIDIDKLRETTPHKKLLAVEKLIENPTVKNAHMAKSDLLTLQRNLNKKTTWLENERMQYNAVSKAIENIEKNMFKSKEGIIDKNLLDKYENIQKSYKEHAVPYVKNKAIQAYKRKEITKEELLNNLKKGEFAAKKGSEHNIEFKESLRNILSKFFGTGITGIGLGIGGKIGYDIFKGHNK